MQRMKRVSEAPRKGDRAKKWNIKGRLGSQNHVNVPKEGTLLRGAS